MKAPIRSFLLLSCLLPAVILQASELIIEGDLAVEGDATVDKSLHVHGDGGVVFKGTGPSGTTPGPGAIPDDSNDVRFMWYPAKGALRFGDPMWGGGNTWQDVYIGIHSTAWGLGHLAIGEYATAWGKYNDVGDLATAWGEYNRAWGWGSTAWGYYNHAENASTAFGVYTLASGGYSTSWGFGATATGDGSTAFGDGTLAEGQNSTAMGELTTAGSMNSVAIGRNNLGRVIPGSPISWIPTDSVFEIGIGDGWSYPLITPFNAMTVLKNGQTTLANLFWDDQNPTAVPTAPEASGGEALVVEGHSRILGNLEVAGVLRTSGAQGDLSMGDFTAAPQ